LKDRVKSILVFFYIRLIVMVTWQIQLQFMGF